MKRKRMPVLFIGHGSPMNAIEKNRFTNNWEEIAKEIPKPKAILVISAHWYTRGTRTSDVTKPDMIYDMYGFPNELYEVKHPVLGAPALAHKTKELIKRKVTIDNDWGYDHGAWSVLYQMYPNADIPVYQLSIDHDLSPLDHYNIGKDLISLRDDGVLILGSGNIVHNLSLVSWDQKGGFNWADEFDNYIKNNILNGNYSNVIDYKKAGKCSELAFFTPEHFYPLLYVLGATSKDEVSIYNDERIMGAMSMTCYLFK